MTRETRGVTARILDNARNVEAEDDFDYELYSLMGEYYNISDLLSQMGKAKINFLYRQADLEYGDIINTGKSTRAAALKKLEKNLIPTIHLDEADVTLQAEDLKDAVKVLKDREKDNIQTIKFIRLGNFSHLNLRFRSDGILVIGCNERTLDEWEQVGDSLIDSQFPTYSYATLNRVAKKGLKQLIPVLRERLPSLKGSARNYKKDIAAIERLIKKLKDA